MHGLTLLEAESWSSWCSPSCSSGPELAIDADGDAMTTTQLAAAYVSVLFGIGALTYAGLTSRAKLVLFGVAILLLLIDTLAFVFS